MNSKVTYIFINICILSYSAMLEAAYQPSMTNTDANPWVIKPTPAQEAEAAAAAREPSPDVNYWSKRPVKREISDQQITEILVKGSVAAYTGECPCPYSTDKNGKKCGDNSEYYRATGDILCYPDDVTQRQIFEFRAKNRIPNPSQPWVIYR